MQIRIDTVIFPHVSKKHSNLQTVHKLSFFTWFSLCHICEVYYILHTVIKYRLFTCMLPFIYR